MSVSAAVSVDLDLHLFIFRPVPVRDFDARSEDSTAALKGFAVLCLSLFAVPLAPFLRMFSAKMSRVLNYLLFFIVNI